MAVLLGLVVAAGYGVGDFFGGLASPAPTPTVLLGAQLVGLAGLLLLTVTLGTEAPSARDVGISAAAGIAGTAGLGSLFHGLAVGRMTVVAPLAAVVASTIPVVWALSTGEDPTALALVGVVVAIGAGALIGLGEDHDVDETPGESRDLTAGIALAPAAGSGFGTALVFFAETSEDSGLCRRSSRGRRRSLVIVVALVTAHRLLPRVEDGRAVVASGVLDGVANSFQLVAVRRAREPCGARRRLAPCSPCSSPARRSANAAPGLRRPACSPPSRGWC